jgi:hypothetical protein
MRSHSCITFIGMKAIRRPPLQGFVFEMIVIGSFACRSFPAPNLSEQEYRSAQQVVLIRADSEVFDAVVRGQLAGTEKDYPFHLDGLRFDSRPAGPAAPFQILTTAAYGVDSALRVQLPDSATLDRITRNRKQILNAAGVEEGGHSRYTNCAGVLVPPPPPPKGSPPSASTGRRDLLAKCPRHPDHYLTVGLPVRGQPDALKESPNAKGRRARLSGEVWTVVVEQNSASPSGRMWTQHAWLLTRNPSSGRLELADTFLLGVIE